MEPIDQLAQAVPARIAVRYGDEPITYGRFASDVDTLSAWLAKRIQPEDSLVGIYLPQNYWAWAAHLAALRLGLKVATLTPIFRKEIAAIGRLDVWLGDTSGVQRLPVARRFIQFSPRSMDPLAGQPEFADGVPPSGGEPMRLILTSGSTGLPKAVRWRADSLRKRIETARDSQGLGPETVLLSLIGIDTAGGFRYPLAIWLAGGCVQLWRPDAEGGQVSALRRALEATNFLVTSPQRLVDMLRRYPDPWAGRAQRKIVVPGGRLAVSTRDRALEIACNTLSVAYGATETGSIATADSIVLNRHPGAVGFAVEGATIEIVDENGARLAPGEEGIVRTRTTYMTNHYVGGAAASHNNAFRGGWFYPGDEGILFADGLLAITGRSSETVNLMGVKIATQAIETRLEKLPHVLELAVVTMQSGKAEALVFAVVCDDQVNPKILQQQIRAQIPAAVPIELVRLRQIPRNSMGKVARAELKEELRKFL